MRKRAEQLSLPMLCFLLLTAPLQAADKEEQKNPDITLEQLQATIQQQQEKLLQQTEQLRQQTEEIRLQSARMDALQRQVNTLQRHEPSPTPAASPSETKTPQTAIVSAQDILPRPTISSGNDRIQLSLSGQVNRAFNIANDGESTDLYPVDNSTSGSRLRFTGTGKINNDLSMGSRIEVGISPDTSSQVSQTSQSPGTWFDQRWTEIYLASTRYGKVSLGKGDTASNGTAEVDLSRTDVAQYAGIADIAGGMLFREEEGNNYLTTLKVSDVFQDRDGLSRQSRLRYDTPSYYGFSLAGSLVTNQRYDAGIFWGGKGYGFKAAWAFAMSDPQLPDKGLQYDGSLAILHQGSGLNFTMSGGLQERDNQEDATNLYGKVGWIADFTKLGNTAFGVDYTRSENLPWSHDSAWSTGVTAVQFFDEVATELYIQYRLYILDQKSGPALEDINVGTMGARVKF
jgi:predicted porin